MQFMSFIIFLFIAGFAVWWLESWFDRAQEAAHKKARYSLGLDDKDDK